MWGGKEMRNIFTEFNSWRQLWWWIAMGIEAYLLHMYAVDVNEKFLGRKFISFQKTFN